MSQVLLETRKLKLAFGGLVVANEIDFQLHSGERLAVIGQNGAGKTTFINICTGLLRPDGGNVYFAGDDITGRTPRSIVRRGMARSFQLPQLFLDHTVRESLQIASASRQGKLSAWMGLGKASDRIEIDHMLDLIGLRDRQHEPCSNLPEGQRKLLDVAMSLMLRPQLLILDEPTSGVSTEDKHTVMETLMSALDEQKVTAIFVEHDVDIVSRYATRVAAWISGGIAADGKPADVLSNPMIQKEVLGL
ncbi:Branched-chain amino acid ABC superfamily ATP binding cassette transporter, ABC protein [Pseudomonas sp. JV551A1]|uniref:ABC transporter ATP-binding protein n=1 Tax=Pseudomonas sp. JV551A1 TaxID=2078787 RepID=UPI00100D6D97|nr:ATP-binding cassette domain-containing protein [Pseudomonas sp. JV551A1]SPO55738.1 Branched-chain amino acid ABC superfamily ATP binding cassette transporter, ABC protein [Pseudomonas sp. JV551A1]